MNKKIITLGGIILAVLVLFIIFGGNAAFSPTATDTKTEENNSELENTIKLKPIDISLPLSNSPKDVAWELFQKYLAYNKDRDLEGVKETVYKIAQVCEDPKQRIDCESRMGSAYSYGSQLKKEDFTNVWSDQKQIILSSDFWLESSEDLDQYGRFRSIIFFIKADDDSWKLLSFSPTQGGATRKGVASQEEVDARIMRYTEDKDEDGRADYEEECLNKPGDSACIKTNPKLRDTDGDGLWDGIEALMR
jgi:hypothetical protein